MSNQKPPPTNQTTQSSEADRCAPTRKHQHHPNISLNLSSESNSSRAQAAAASSTPKNAKANLRQITPKHSAPKIPSESRICPPKNKSTPVTPNSKQHCNEASSFHDKSVIKPIATSTPEKTPRTSAVRNTPQPHGKLTHPTTPVENSCASYLSEDHLTALPPKLVSTPATGTHPSRTGRLPSPSSKTYSTSDRPKSQAMVEPPSMITDQCRPESRPQSTGATNMCYKIGPQGLLPSKSPEGKKERVLKLEIMSFSGSSFYDVDKIHEAAPKGKMCKEAPKYDPEFDVDRMGAFCPPRQQQPAGKVDQCVKERVEKPPNAKKGIEDETEYVDDSLKKDTFSKTGSTFSQADITLSEAVSQGKRLADDEDDVMRSAPLGLVEEPLSPAMSLLDQSQIKEEKEEKAEEEAPLPPIGDVRDQKDLGDSVPYGDVSLPNDSDLLETDADKTGGASKGVLFKGKQGVESTGGEGAAKERQESETPTNVNDSDLLETDADKTGGAGKGVQFKGKQGVESTGGEGAAKERQESETPTNVSKTSPEEGDDRKPVPEEATPSEQPAVGVNDRRSVILIGPSVRDLGHVALAPLTALRTLLGPGPNSTPSRKKRSRRLVDDVEHPSYFKMKSFRCALVMPYDAAAKSLGYFLRRPAHHFTKRLESSVSRDSHSSDDDSN